MGKKIINKFVLVWSGIISFLLNFLGCDLWAPYAYAPLFYGDFEANARVIDSETLLPVKGVKVSLKGGSGNYEIASDITDESGAFNIEKSKLTSSEYTIYIHDIDPNADGSYKDKTITMVLDEMGDSVVFSDDIKVDEVK